MAGLQLVFTPDLATGIQEIDAQHQEIFNRINMLFDASSRGKGRDEVQHFLNFMSEYVLSHFSVEEKHMLKFNYPGYETHKTLHAAFLKSVGDLSAQFAAGGASSYLVVQVQNYGGSWLRTHIKQEDKKLAEFLRTKL